MKRKIELKELHSMASQMKYYDFENWVAKELFDQPETVNTSELTDKLFLHNAVGQKEQLLAFIEWYDSNICQNDFRSREELVEDFLSQ